MAWQFYRLTRMSFERLTLSVDVQCIILLSILMTITHIASSSLGQSTGVTAVKCLQGYTIASQHNFVLVM